VVRSSIVPAVVSKLVICGGAEASGWRKSKAREEPPFETVERSRVEV
jgi:hypothetical protein